MCPPFWRRFVMDFVPLKREKVSLAPGGLALGARNCYNNLVRIIPQLKGVPHEIHHRAHLPGGE